MAEITRGKAPPSTAEALSTGFEPQTADGKPISANYRLGILLLLCTTYALNMADRGILGTLIPPIKKEFALEDWQIGLLAGPIFALVYSIASIPLSTLADKSNRRNLIGITALCFSTATALSGLAGSYLQLAVARFLTGATESATVPAANSIIADLYPPERRPSAISTFTAGGSAGGILSGLIGGFVAHHYGWREAFFVAGIPGILLAVLIFVFMREPRRMVSAKIAAERNSVSFATVLKHLWSQPTFRWLCAGTMCIIFHNRGAGTFRNLFLVQTHGFDLQQLGIVSTICGVGGIFVIVAVGRMMDRLVAKTQRWLMWVPAIIAIGVVPFTLGMLLSGDKWVAISIGGVADLIDVAYVGPMVATVHAVVPNSMRARAVALQVMIATLFGMGLGPPFAGFVSSALEEEFGPTESLRWSLAVMLLPNLVAGFCYWKAAQHIIKDALKARSMDGLAPNVSPTPA